MPRAVVAEVENPPSLLGFPKKAASPNSAVWVGGEKKVSGYQSLDEAIISLFFFLSFPSPMCTVAAVGRRGRGLQKLAAAVGKHLVFAHSRKEKGRNS